jgi:hypothetical protein
LAAEIKRIPARIMQADALKLETYGDESGFAVHQEKLQAVKARLFQYLAGV